MSGIVQKVHFPPGGSFYADLKREVDAYLARAGKDLQGGWALHLQTAAMLCWFVLTYWLLVFVALAPWQTALLAISLGLAVAGIGFNVMHDANHGSYSTNARTNRALGFTLDLIGGSSYLWRQKHNILHHTYTNIAGMDTDGDAGPFLRLAPAQVLRPFHRFQHVYAWLLYLVFALKWWFFDDFRELITGRIGGHRYPRPKAPALAAALLGKALFFGWAFVLPIVLHPTWWLVPIWLLASATIGLVLASVFQLAHCVEEAAHFNLEATHEASSDWATLQVTTTVDFARANRILSWYVGGLNYQVEHHLFTRICHTRYPELAPIVERVCREHGLAYRAQPTLRSALRANVRYLRELGRAS